MNSIKRAIMPVALVVALGACGGGDSRDQHIASALRFLDNADHEAAIIELKNALQIESADAEARWLLGSTYLEIGDMAAAESQLRRAWEMGWKPDDVVPALAEALLALGEYEEVRELEQKNLQTGAEAGLLATKALAELGLGNPASAQELIGKAMHKDPAATAVMLANARILAATGDPAGASEVLDAILSREPENGLAWSLRGDVHQQRRELKEALAAYDEAMGFRKNPLEDRVKHALLALQMGNMEAARADAEALERSAPRHPLSNYVRGLLLFQEQKYTEAIASFTVAEPASDNLPQLLFYLGAAHLMEGNQAQAAVYANQFFGRIPDHVGGRKLLAVIRLQDGKYQDVQDLLQPVLDAVPDDIAALNLMANALLADGRVDEGIALLARVAALQPDSPVAQVRLGASLLAGGKEEDAVRHIEAALELDPRYQQADILLVLNHLQKKDYPAAIDAAEAFRRRNLTNLTSYNLLGRVYLEAGQPAEARESFEKALTLDRADPTANHNLAQMAMSENDLDQARLHYLSVLEGHEHSMPSLLGLVRLASIEGDEKSFVTYLERAIQAHPAAIEPRLYLSRYYLNAGQPEKVAPLLNGLNESQRRSPEVLAVMAMAQLSAREHEDARYTLEQLLEDTPESADGHYLMGMAASRSGDIEQSRRELQRALELDGNHVPSRIVLARMALMDKETEEFRRHLEKLGELAPENTDVLLLRAADANGTGDSAAAINLVVQAYGLSPNARTLMALAAYRQAAGDTEAAEKLYDDWLVEHPDDITIRMALAKQLLQEQRLEEAKSQYQQVIELDRDNAYALNNIAWLLREEQPQEALEYARRASGLSPDSSRILDTLAVVEYMNKDYRQARRSIRRALEIAPKNPSIIYHSAMIENALGNDDEARSSLEGLLSGAASFPEIDEARQLLATLNQ